MGQNITNSTINRIAFIGNYLPRQFGIATSTYDLYEAIFEQYSSTTCIVLPVNDVAAGYAYPNQVRGGQLSPNPNFLYSVRQTGTEYPTYVQES